MASSQSVEELHAFKSVEDLRNSIGLDLGPTHWIEVTQEKIDIFGKLTEDEQWIHHDVERAAVTELGSTVAHGYFILALAAPSVMGLMKIENSKSYINYGLNRVRFPSPIKSGSRIRGHLRLMSVDDARNGVIFVVEARMEIEGQEKPGCIAEILTYVTF